ncbi:hypothetical protein scyTo_0027052 [Scyliorhinus torazame]|uniref:Uncharacterized protein n=1 Tax=Scyliorhinus torazame TaxID=75743 RepID=A0A401QLP7_SCYTO|nr:hypothetical protein [Scyliorhinus torazame]
MSNRVAVINQTGYSLNVRLSGCDKTEFDLNNERVIVKRDGDKMGISVKYADSSGRNYTWQEEKSFDQPKEIRLKKGDDKIHIDASR